MPDSQLQPVDNSGCSYVDAPADGPAPDETDGGIRYACPRCGTEVTSAFYGPCETCRADLRARISAEAVDVTLPTTSRR
ncbi:MAG: hypothetical protein M5U19_11205 [Microthrixaceae bacterium]|nr:hypothetical protein [Microthrixaceae bacterium]